MVQKTYLPKLRNRYSLCKYTLANKFNYQLSKLSQKRIRVPASLTLLINISICYVGSWYLPNKNKATYDDSLIGALDGLRHFYSLLEHTQAESLI